MKKIALFKAAPSEESENTFETLLTKENYEVISIKTLDFTFKNLQELKTCLGQPAKYAGIIFTSPRCVTSVQTALNGESLRAEWPAKKNYGVGPKTVECARANIGLQCDGADAGNAANLAEIILSQSQSDLPFLYPRGNLSKDTLKQKLNVDELIVYETIKSPQFEEDLKLATNNFTMLLDYIVFFSPSGVQAMLPFFNQINHENVKIIAIGPTTEASLKESNISVDGTPEKPSAESLITLLNTF